jgi:hypothetical protein
MEDPKIGDMVLHNNGCRAEVIALGSIATNRGLATTYNLKFFERMIPSVNCLREEFTFPLPTTARIHRASSGVTCDLAFLASNLTLPPRLL